MTSSNRDRLPGVLTMIAIIALLFSGCGMPEPDTPLTAAAARGDAARVSGLLREGASPDLQDGHGLSALILAARRGDLPVMRALLEAGADVDARDHFVNGWTALMHAVHKGQIHAASALLDAGADVNAANRLGVTALMLAAGEEGEELVRLLLERGADPRARASHGSSALANAVACGRTGSVEALLAKDPGLSLSDALPDRVAMLLARLRGRGEILRMLRERGAPADTRTRPAGSR